MVLKTGDDVTIRCDGRTVDGKVLLASSNGLSVMLGFEAILHGQVGMMPVSRQPDGGYESLFGSHVVEILPARDTNDAF